jgi:hypothetical protein
MGNFPHEVDSSQVLKEAFDRDAKTLSVSRNDDIMRVDNPNATTIYVGWARPGTTAAQALWKIKRIVFTSSNTQAEIGWAEGESTYSNIWANRASLNYS